VTQRGNRGGRVFFSDADRTVYLDWLGQYSERHGLRVLAYCLMPNHIHLVAVPERDESLALVLCPLQSQHAQRVNQIRRLDGHLWHSRYYSCALDDHHTWAAIRYVELNPVRAGLAERPEEFEWSSARAHCGLRDDILLWDGFPGRADAPDDWSEWLAQGPAEGLTNDEAAALRLCTGKGLPCGGRAFVAKLEGLCGRELTLRRRGRPRLNSQPN
jgi:putative transposase